jgi:two-component system response regulator FixJ
MADTIAVVLIDDDRPVLESTLQLLAREGISASAFESAEAFLASRAGAGMAHGCIVSDVRMPGMSGLDLLAELRRRDSRIPVILLTGHGDVRMAVEALKAGAFDFLEKPTEIDELCRAIRSATKASETRARDEQLRQEIGRRAAELSARQRQVMNLVVEGYSSRQIAEHLGISPRTVETYRLTIMEKMGAGSVAALVRMAMALAGEDPETST